MFLADRQCLQGHCSQQCFCLHFSRVTFELNLVWTTPAETERVNVEDVNNLQLINKTVPTAKLFLQLTQANNVIIMTVVTRLFIWWQHSIADGWCRILQDAAAAYWQINYKKPKSLLHCVSKNIPNIFECNLKTNYQILIIFGTNIPDTTCHQMTIQLPTLPNVCFCST